MSILHSLLLPLALLSAADGKLPLHFDNLSGAGGVLRLALYADAESFMVEKKARLYSFEIKGKTTMDVEIPGLPYGDYAFAVFQDENSNGKLDKNALGIPVEPYAFSGNPPSKWRMPKFEEARFVFDKSAKRQTVRLNKWSL
jgi:uncharacterized protein (DUF2141 family)